MNTIKVPKPEPGRWNHSAVVAKKPSIPKENRKDPETLKKITNLSANRNPKSPKCLIKITGSRYNGTFLVSVDPTMDDAIYKTMREIEVGLGHQLKRKPSIPHMAASPKSCLSSVFKCFTQSSTLQDPKKNCFVESKKKPNSHGIKDKRKLESRPHWAKLPKEIELMEASNIKEFISSSIKFKKQEDSDVNLPNPISERGNVVVPTKASENPNVEESSSKLKEKMKSIISDSDDKIVMLQTPKPLSCNGCSAIEMGLEVKAKGTTKEVSRLTAPAKDEVQIDVQVDNRLPQNGNRILLNGDKRSLHVTIEEDGDGKPSLKLAFTGGNHEVKMKTDQRYPPNNDDYMLQVDPNNYVQVVKKRDSDDSTTDTEYKERKSSQKGENKSCKSIEVQVSDKLGPEKDSVKLHELKPPIPSKCINYPSKLNSSCRVGFSRCSRNVPNNFTSCKTFPYKLMKVFRRGNPKTHHDDGGISVPETVTEIHRVPYLVHRLYDPNSASSSRSEHIEAVYRTMNPQTSIVENNKISQKTRLDDLSCSYTKNNDPERYTSINEECYDYHPTRDFGMSTSTVDDFEKVLQNICGPNYWYHRSETSNLSRHDVDMGEKNDYCSTRKLENRMGLNCNRESQTENLKGNITEGQTEVSYVDLLNDRSLDNINSDDFSHLSNADLRHRKIRTVHTCTESDLIGREKKSGNRYSDLKALVMAENEFLKKFKSLQIGRPKPSIGCFEGTPKQARTSTGNGFREEVVNCDHISFEESPPQLGGGLHLNTRKKVLCKSLSGYESSDSMNNFFFCESQMNFTNMTSCNGVSRRIGDETVEGKFKRYQQQAISNCRRAIKIKSRSCQDIFVSRNQISKPEVQESVIPKTAERRCQCFRVGGSGEGLDYGISDTKQSKRLEGGIEKSKLKDYKASHLERTSWRSQNLPPEIGSLFPPRPSFLGSAVAKYSEIFGSQSGYKISLDRLNTVANVDMSDQWRSSNATQLVQSHTFVTPKRSGVFQRAILTIRKKITSIFGKKLANESIRNVSKFTFNKHDKIVFIPVPLEKKYENIHLIKKKRNKFIF